MNWRNFSSLLLNRIVKNNTVISSDFSARKDDDWCDRYSIEKEWFRIGLPSGEVDDWGVYYNYYTIQYTTCKNERANSRNRE